MQSVIFSEDDEGCRARVRTDEERVLRGRSTEELKKSTFAHGAATW